MKSTWITEQWVHNQYCREPLWTASLSNQKASAVYLVLLLPSLSLLISTSQDLLLDHPGVLRVLLLTVYTEGTGERARITTERSDHPVFHIQYSMYNMLKAICTLCQSTHFKWCKKCLWKPSRSVGVKLQRVNSFRGCWKRCIRKIKHVGTILFSFWEEVKM